MKEYRIRNAEGNVRWVNESGMAAIGEDGEVQHLDGVIFDVTLRKQAENALEESEKRYRTLFDSANDAIVILQNNLCIDCNYKALELFGRAREQIIGHPPYDFSPPYQPDGRDSHEKALEIITKVLEGEPSIFEWRHTRLNGEVFDAEVSFSLIEIESEKFIQAILRDISVRKKLGKELQLMQRWIERSVDLFFWVGKDSQILYANQAVCHALDCTGEELRTLKVSDFDLGIPPEAWPVFTQKVREQGSFRFESRLRKKKWSGFSVEITANTLNYEGKDHFFAYARDITDRIKAEEALRLSEDKYRSIFENAFEGIFRSTPDGRLLIADPALAHNLGFSSPQELLDHIKDLETHLYVDRERRKELLRLLDRDGYVSGFEAELKRKDGSVASVIMNVNVVHDGNKQIRYFEGTIEDITFQKMAEQEKKKVEIQLQQAQKMEAIGTLELNLVRP